MLCLVSIRVQHLRVLLLQTWPEATPAVEFPRLRSQSLCSCRCARDSMERKYGLGAKWAKMPAEVDSRTARHGQVIQQFFLSTWYACARVRAVFRSIPMMGL